MDIQGRTNHGLGAVRLNKEHKNNLLTPVFVNQVRRGVETMYHDHSAKLVYLTTVQGKQFCNGTDFRTIMHYRDEGQEDKIAAYLEDV